MPFVADAGVRSYCVQTGTIYMAIIRIRLGTFVNVIALCAIPTKATVTDTTS